MSVYQGLNRSTVFLNKIQSQTSYYLEQETSYQMKSKYDQESEHALKANLWQFILQSMLTFCSLLTK